MNFLKWFRKDPREKEREYVPMRKRKREIPEPIEIRPMKAPDPEWPKGVVASSPTLKTTTGRATLPKIPAPLPLEDDLPRYVQLLESAMDEMNESHVVIEKKIRGE